VCIQADFSRCLTGQLLQAVETPFLGYRDIYGGSGSSRPSGSGPVEESGTFKRYCQGSVEIVRGPKDHGLPLSDPYDSWLACTDYDDQSLKAIPP
jgi:hypothetical protein